MLLISAFFIFNLNKHALYIYIYTHTSSGAMCEARMHKKSSKI